MSTTASRIGEINLVMIPSTDQDRSIEFYETLGFEKRTDIPFGGRYRWVEVYPPRGTTGIALAPPREGDPTGIQTGISLTQGTGGAVAAAYLCAGRVPTRRACADCSARLPHRDRCGPRL